MAESSPPEPGLASPSDAGNEARIRQFERDWLAGRRPSIDEFLPGPGFNSTELLIELVQIELEFRIKAGLPARAGDYLARYPQLAADLDVAADLIASEFDLRRRNDPTLSFDAFASHYPQYLDRLGRHPVRSRPARSVGALAGAWPQAPGYEILGRLGAGGMGVVYKARDQRLGRVVALKFLPPEYTRDPSRLALFHREARTASALNHPHICTVHDLGEQDGRPFIVMEYVEGRTIRELIGERPGIAETARLIAQAARALAVAHVAGVVHRDIKPENLMVRADGYLKVLDFGLSRRLPGTAPPGSSTQRESDSAGVIGTVPYMSPEQARSQSPGPPSDVFSLGVVLYELATGAHPFSGGSPLDTLVAIAEATPVPASRLNPEITPALDALVARMLEKEPAARPSAAEVDAALSVPMEAPAAPAKPSLEASRWTVGRAGEHASLRDALAETEAGTGLMVCLVGEPGIGKTTLVDGFLAELAAEGRAVHVARGRCSERLAEAEAYLPVLDALDALVRGPTGSTAARYLCTLAPSWAAELRLSPVPATHAEAGAPAASQTRLKRELVTFLTELSRRAPVILFVDDIHWADLPTADLLAYLGRNCPGMRLLVLLTYRRDELFLANHPFVPVQRDLVGRRVCREISLALLSRADVDRYLIQAFPDHSFPPDLAEALHARTGGNPLFLAELVRFLRDRGVISRKDEKWALGQPVQDAVTEMPESVRGLIRRKLDQLNAVDRALLSAAAAQSGEFDSAVVARATGEEAAVVEERLEEIERVHGLIRLVREHEFPDRTISRRYGFVHAMYQDALSAGLAPARRAAVCRAAADALVALRNGQPGLAAAELALLYEAGREFGRAADLFHAASQNASRVFAHRESAILARRGLALLRGLPETEEQAAREFRLQMTLGLQLQITDGFAAPNVEEAYAQARAVWEKTPGVGPVFPILWGLWLVYKVRSDLGRAHLLAGELLALAQQSGDTALILQARQAAAIVALCAGEPATALNHAESGARLYDPDRHRNLTFQFGQDPGVACLAFGAVALWLVGDEREATARSRDAVRLARDGSQPSTLALALHFAAMLHQLRGDPEAVREYASESLAISVEHRFAFWHAGATVLLGWATAVTSQDAANPAYARKARTGATDGISVLERGIEAWRATGSATYRTYSLTLLADALRQCGRLGDAIAALDEAERSIVETAERLSEPEIHRLRGEVLSATNPEGAEAALRTAVAASTRQRACGLQLRSALSLGRFLSEQGRVDEARSVVAAALDQNNGLRDSRELLEARKFLRT
jgi:predicted ATPase